MEWDFCPVILPKRLIDGTFARGLLMRRRVHGQWQWRRPTDAEETEWYYLRAY
jgi:hypothetical protein